MDKKVSVSNLDVPGHLIRRLHQQSTQIFSLRTQAAGFDITPVQYAALEAIFENPGADQAKVAEMIGYDRATIGGVVERLEKKGWIRRVVSESDRRARELSLTPKGNSTRMTLHPIVQALQKEILQPLLKNDQDLFIQLARQVVLTP
jgi:DNA-binding MarR family transcriptional regulator